MEALAAFGIACNVMQTIKFTFEVSDACKKAFRDGSVDPDLTQLAKRSAGIFTDLTQSLGQFQPMDEDQHELAGIARDCLAASDVLNMEVAKIAHAGAQGKHFRSLRLGVRAKMKESKIEKLRAKMQRHQAVLELRLLIRVW